MCKSVVQNFSANVVLACLHSPHVGGGLCRSVCLLRDTHAYAMTTRLRGRLLRHLSPGHSAQEGILPCLRPLLFVGILGALLVGAVSPGPSFVLVSRIAATASRRDGLWAAMGMGLGGAMFATLALLGLATVLLRIEWLYLVLRSLAVTRRRAARSALLANEQSRRVRGFRCRGPNERHS